MMVVDKITLGWRINWRKKGLGLSLEELPFFMLR